MLSHMKIEMNIVVQIAHMRDDVVLVYFTSKPRLGTKFFAFPLSMRESCFQLYCAGNSLLLILQRYNSKTRLGGKICGSDIKT